MEEPFTKTLKVRPGIHLHKFIADEIEIEKVLFSVRFFMSPTGSRLTNWGDESYKY